MIQAALVHSRRNGETGWIRVPKGSRVRVRGMKHGDVLNVSYRPGPGEFYIEENGDYEIREGTSHMRVKHEECSGARVSVDLVRERSGRG